MGNKCCAHPNGVSNKVIAVNTSELAAQLQLQAEAISLLQSIHEQPQSMRQNNEMNGYSQSNHSEQQSNADIVSKSSLSLPQNTNTKRPPIAQSPKTLNNSARHLSEIIKNDNVENTKIERLEVPVLNKSPTIRISKEWMGKNSQNEPFQLDNNSLTKKRTMGAKRAQAIELNIMIQQQVIESPHKAMSPKHDEYIRKQSTIHQIKKRRNRQFNQQQPGSSPNGSEVSVDNWQKGNNSMVTSQNSINSQQKKNLAYLDQILLNTQQSVGHQQQYQALDDYLLSENGQDNKKSKHMSQTNRKYLNLQNIREYSQDPNQLYHMSTPQFNHESFIRGTSRSSTNEELLHLYQQRLLEKDREESAINLIQSMQEEYQNQINQQQSQNSQQIIFSGFGFGGRSPSTSPFMAKEEKRNSQNHQEIMEDVNESRSSSIQEFNKRFNHQKISQQNSKARKQSSLSNIEKGNFTNYSPSKDNDSFKSSASMAAEDDDIQIPLNQIKSTDSRTKELGQKQYQPQITFDNAKRNSIVKKQLTFLQKETAEEQIMQFLSTIKNTQKYQKIGTINDNDRSPKLINIQDVDHDIGSQSPLKSINTVISSIQQQSSYQNQSTKYHFNNLINMVRQQSNQTSQLSAQQTMKTNFSGANQLRLNTQLSSQMSQVGITGRQETKDLIKDIPKEIPKPGKSMFFRGETSAGNSQMGRNQGLLRPIKTLTRIVKDDEGLQKMVTILNQKKHEEMKNDMKNLIREQPSNNNISQLTSQKDLTDLNPKINITHINDNNTEEDIFELSEMLGNTQDCVTPSEFGYTPMSTYDKKQDTSIWFNPDASLDYSTLQIEYMADNTNSSITPKDGFNQFVTGNLTPKIHMNPNPTPWSNIIKSNSIDRTKQGFQDLNSNQNKTSNDETPKSQITKSVISGRDDKGKRKINQYIVMNELGKGSYAEVYLCINTDTKTKHAMKILNKKKLNRIFLSKTRTALQDVEKEIAIMKKLDHPNVVSLVEVLDDPTNDKLYIIMEYMCNGSLMKKMSKMKAFNLQIAWKYFRDLIQGLNYLHECAGVIHRDIKPDNLLVDENDTLKIADFGVSFLMENGSDQIATTAGSNYFFSPEVCLGTTFKGRKSDIWAAGVTLYQMVFKKYPFTSNNIPDLYNKIQNKEPDYPEESNIQLVDLLKKMFIKDPNERASLVDIMNHDWVTSNGITPIPRILYPKVEVTKKDTEHLFKNIWMISKIKLKLKQQIINRRASKGKPGQSALNNQQ